MADALNDSVTVKVEASIFFFRVAPDSPKGDALISFIQAARSGESAVDAAIVNKAMSALGPRISGDPQAVKFCQDDIEAGGNPVSYIAALTKKASDWVSAHALQIVKAHPECGLPILFNLQNAGVDPTPVGVAIAREASRDPSFSQMLGRYIDNPGPIQQAMASGL